MTMSQFEEMLPLENLQTALDERQFFETISQKDIVFNEDNFEKLFQKFPRIIDDHVKNAKYLAIYLVSSYLKGNNDHKVSLEKVCALNIRFLNEISDCQTVEEVERTAKRILIEYRMIEAARRPSVNDKENHYVAKCKKYIRSHLNEKLTPEQIASVIALSPAYLSTIFHRDAGMTIVDYIQETKIDAAKKILITSDDKISKIAEDLNFSTPSYFCRVFEKVVGCTPQEFRRRQLKQLYFKNDSLKKETLDSEN